MEASQNEALTLVSKALALLKMKIVGVHNAQQYEEAMILLQQAIDKLSGV